jgi:hypothetical protein
MSAEAFFQVFEQRVQAVRYEYGHDIGLGTGTGKPAGFP